MNIDPTLKASLRARRLLAVTASLAALSPVMTACSSDNDPSVSKSSASAIGNPSDYISGKSGTAKVDGASKGSLQNSYNSSSDVTINNGAKLTFDYLGANSKVVKVYPVEADGSVGQQADGTYYSGEHVTALCKVTDREVHSVPPEQPRSSDQWLMFESDALGGVENYATAVYAKHPMHLLAQLQEC